MAEPFSTLREVIFCNLDHAEGGFTFLQRDGGERFTTWAELSREALRRAHHLRAEGLAAGDRVALILPDGEELVLTLLGAIAAGLAPVPMYPPSGLGRFASYLESTAKIVHAAGARVVITSARLQKLLWPVLDRAPGVERLVAVERFRDAPAADDLPPHRCRPDDVLFLQFTSGSTATPKGVRVTHASALANCRAIMTHVLGGEPGRDKGLSWLPMYHDMGLIGFVLAPLIHRVPVVFLPTLSFIEDPSRWMAAISRHRATITFAPNFALALAVKRTPAAELDRLDLSCLRVVGCGAEPNHPETLRGFAAHFARAGLDAHALVPCYGLAEATLAVAFGDAGAPLHTEVIDRALY